MNTNLFSNSKAPGEGAYLNTNAIVSCETINNQKEGGTTLQESGNEDDEFYNSIAKHNDANVVGDIIAYIRNLEKLMTTVYRGCYCYYFKNLPILLNFRLLNLKKERD